MYRATDFVPPDADLSQAERIDAGIGGTDSARVLRVLDPIPEVRDEGVEVRQHPEMLLLGEPDLWAVVHEYRCCAGDRDLTRRDYATRSAWWVEAWLTMRAAHQREERRELEAIRAGGSHG